MIHGTPIAGVNYALAFSTGQGKGNNDIDQREDGKDTILHLDTNLAEIKGNKESVYHVGASYGFGDLPPAVLGLQRTEALGAELFGITTFGGTSMERNRYNLEFALAQGPVKVQGEYANANFKGDTGTVGFDRDLSAHYAEALWLVTGEKYADAFKGGKFDRIVPKNNFSPSGNGLGAIELGLRYSEFDASDFTTGNATGTGILSTGKVNKADSYTVGLKWIPDPNVRFLVNYVNTDYDGTLTIATGKTATKEKALIMRAQYDF